MTDMSTAKWLLRSEAHGLLTRVNLLKPFSLTMPTVAAASVSHGARTAIERHMDAKRREMRGLVREFLRWLDSREGRAASSATAQRRYCIIKLQINNGMTQFDIFADVLTQRSEHETGVWIAGLDAFASEALTLADHFYFSPPVVCYVDRGHGAAIRRVKTQLPGGGINPIAIIRIPRERLVGSGIAASLVHEVGHQGSVLLRLVESLHPVLQGMARRKPNRQDPWILWDRWISEILSDLWAVAKLGITATVGLMSVMSLPRAFVFRLDAGDPHPLPWIRVVLSCALGHKLYPHPQWGALCDAWESCYPLEGVDREDQQAIRDLLSTMPGLVDVIVDHKPASLRGKSIGGVLRMRERTPAHLMKIHDAWNLHPESMSKAPPTLAFAVLGQARVQGRISAEDESQTLASLLNVWALTTSLTNPRMQNNLTVGRRRIQC